MILEILRTTFWCTVRAGFAAMGVTAGAADLCSTTPGRLVRDEFPWPFHRLSMPEAPRSIVIPVGTNLQLAFDVKTLRTHTVWSGGKLQRGGYVFGGRGDAMCRPNGAILWTLPAVYPWAIENIPAQPASETPAGSDYRGVSTRDGVVQVYYDVAAGAGNAVRVHEMPRVEIMDGVTALVRRFEIAPVVSDARRKRRGAFHREQRYNGRILTGNQYAGRQQSQRN